MSYIIGGILGLSLGVAYASSGQTIEEMLIQHEGLHTQPYVCPQGYLTIGVGRNLDTVGITEEEALYLLRNDIDRATVSLQKYSFWENLNDTRKAALIDLTFNVGASGFATFVDMIEALNNQDYEQASVELLDSKYATQVGDRAIRIAQMLKQG